MRVVRITKNFISKVSWNILKGMKYKKTIDARSFSHETLEEMRMSAVKRVAEGESPEAVAMGLGINRRTIYCWLMDYHYGGVAALKAKPLLGAPRKLDAVQMERLANIVRDENSLQRKFESALWTLALIREVIKSEFDVALSEVSTGRLMKRQTF